MDMKIEVGTVKGFQDFLPPVSLKRSAVKRIIEKYFRLYGFVPVETPVVEFDEIMKPSDLPSEGEDSAISDRFRLQDRGKRNLGLRYEFTFQLARIFKENPNLKLPFRRYQIGEVFRDEPISGAGRFRQFTQCDIDIAGDPSISADADCLATFSSILKELKITNAIEVNNRKLLNALIDSVEINNKKQVMRELDKLDKIGEDGVKANLKKYANTNQILTLFKLLEKDLKFFRENAFEGADELEELIEECKIRGVKIKLNTFLMRGFSYYTGNVFEIKNEGKTIAGGGRYDKSVGRFLNRDIPAVGISFGLERITSLANVDVEAIPKALIISISQGITTEKLASLMRKNEISCLTTENKPGKAMEYANSLNIPYIVFVGSDEVEKKKFKLKDMKTGDEKLLTEKSLIKFLSK